MDNAACCIGELATRAIEADDIASSEADCRFNQFFNATAKFQVLQGYFPEGYNRTPAQPPAIFLDLSGLNSSTFVDQMHVTFIVTQADGTVVTVLDYNGDYTNFTLDEFLDDILDRIIATGLFGTVTRNSAVFTIEAKTADAEAYSNAASVFNIDIWYYRVTDINGGTGTPNWLTIIDPGYTYNHYYFIPVPSSNNILVYNASKLSVPADTITMVSPTLMAYNPSNNLLLSAKNASITVNNLALIQFAPAGASTINYVTIPEGIQDLFYNSFNNCVYVVCTNNVYKVANDSLVSPTVTTIVTGNAVQKTFAINPYNGDMFGVGFTGSVLIKADNTVTNNPVQIRQYIYPFFVDYGATDSLFLVSEFNLGVGSPLYVFDLTYNEVGTTNAIGTDYVVNGIWSTTKDVLLVSFNDASGIHVYVFDADALTLTLSTRINITGATNYPEFYRVGTGNEIGASISNFIYFFDSTGPRVESTTFTPNVPAMPLPDSNCITAAKAQTIMDSLKADCTLCNCNSDYERTPDPTPTVDNPVNNFLVDDDGNIITDDEGNPILIA